jgi:hypothetical protein
MKTILDVHKFDTDFKEIETSDPNRGHPLPIRLKVFPNVNDLCATSNANEMLKTTIFDLWIEIGYEQEKTIMIDVPMEDLELFAHSVLKQIEIVRKNYAELIQKQKDLGFYDF